MQPAQKVIKLLPRVEAVEQLYDGLNGKVIAWTLQNGNDHKDPSCLAFLVGRDGKVVSKCKQAYAASSFSKWLKTEVDKYEKQHPRTRVPFLPPTLEGGSGARDAGTCIEFDEARAASKPILIYVGRESLPEDKKAQRAARREVKACRKFERGTLGSKKAAEAAKGWLLLRFDIADKAHARWLKAFGVEAVPTLLMWAGGDERPTSFDAKLKGPSLAYRLRKARE